MSRLCLYYRVAPETDRFVPGDRYARPLVRRLIRGKPRVGGVERAFMNLCGGLDMLGVDYVVNPPFAALTDDDCVGVLGRGRYALEGYDRPNPVVAGIGLMTHPSEWPTLCDEHPVVRYLQHSQWANDIYKPYFGERCGVWPVGIDTETWAPQDASSRDADVLVYDKIFWERERLEPALLAPIMRVLQSRGLRALHVRYGAYDEATYKAQLARCRFMLFMSAHESQGLAYQECLSCDVPVLAWDQGAYLDPHRFEWGTPDAPATSVPYFDARCGERFRGIKDFAEQLDVFLERLQRNEFRPRDYVVENLGLDDCARRFMGFFDRGSRE